MPVDAADVPAVACMSASSIQHDGCGCHAIANVYALRGRDIHGLAWARRGCLMSGQLTRKLPLRHCPPVVPDLDQTIVSARDKALIVRAPADTMARLPVALKAIDIRQMGCKVLDHAPFVGTDERLAVVRPAHRPDPVVVDLRNALIVERRSVPEGKLALVVARQQPPAVGRPGDDPGRGAFLVDGCVHELVAYRSNGVGRVRSRWKDLLIR